MAHRIRRGSMEHLELYDLDKFTLLSSNRQLRPPLPPPRKYRCRLPAKQTFERYRFLCDTKRLATDPIYAATPMFTIIPQSTPVKHPRRLLGARVPSDIIKPRSTTSSESSESQGAERNNNTKEEESNDDDDDHQNAINDNSKKNDNDNDSESSSGSRDDDGIDDIINNDDDNFDDDDNNQGIVESIFNPDKNTS
ncbi:unnamed protein product [Rotaria sp. Silwood2]|nr:unnamed protein product [Rotaria sp. Silwood2]CAF2939157.1 unnamed protein product [Rotaria sp. Silwood2]CAF3281974.1 unnamed protein product [Rotaria sp. Silwood2]CAF3317445.1 unnamed protein product [Rotaria sp. Silwood2]CAF4171116.1 unnamed protein product [Rotaria sp. Silwood2]